MATITCRGTCVPPGPSKKTAGWPLTGWASEGNCERTQSRSRVVDEEAEVCSAMGIADILIEGGTRTGLPPRIIRHSMRNPKGRSDSGESTVSLKRYSDTKQEFFGNGSEPSLVFLQAEKAGAGRFRQRVR